MKMLDKITEFLCVCVCVCAFALTLQLLSSSAVKIMTPHFFPGIPLRRRKARVTDRQTEGVIGKKKLIVARHKLYNCKADVIHSLSQEPLL